MKPSLARILFSGALLPWPSWAKPPATPRRTCSRDTTPIQNWRWRGVAVSLAVSHAGVRLLPDTELENTPLALAAHVRGRRVEAGVGECGQLVAPRVPKFPTARPRASGAIGLDSPVGDFTHHQRLDFTCSGHRARIR